MISWSTHISEIEFFNLVFKIPLNEKNYIQNILDFDKTFLINGHKYKIFNFPQIETEDHFIKKVNEYILLQLLVFFSPTRN
jgi:hypothetical protein